MSKDFLNRSQQQHTETNSETPQKKIDHDAYIEWMNNAPAIYNFGVYGNNQAAQGHNQTAQLFSRDEEEQVQRKGDKDELQMNPGDALMQGLQRSMAASGYGKSSMPINDNPALEKEADVMGSKAAQGKSADITGNSSSSQVQAYTEQYDINSLAKTVHDAIKGLGTDENAIFDVLNHSAETVLQVISKYNSSYNDLSGQGMVQDIINDTSGRVQELSLYLIKRANIAIPESTVDDNMQIVKGGILSDKNKVEPGSRVNYSAPGGYKKYEWYVLNNPFSRQIADKNEAWYFNAVPIYNGGNSKDWSGKWDYSGAHTVACRAEKKDGSITYFEKDEYVGSRADEIPKEHASYEIMAHKIAYMNKAEIIQNTKVKDLVTNWKYQPQQFKEINGKLGFYAILLTPQGGSSQIPVLAFRGTEPTDVKDIYTDLDYQSPGYKQYNLNKEKIANLINSVPGKVILTGHSLGGALAQYAAVDFTSKVHSVVTFQSPAISASIAKKFNDLPKDQRPEVTHHIINNDLVDLSGEKHLDGNFYLHHLKNYISPLAAHGAFAFSSPNFEKHREAMGIDLDFYKEVAKVDVNTEKYFMEKYEKHPNPIKRGFVESIRKKILN